MLIRQWAARALLFPFLCLAPLEAAPIQWSAAAGGNDHFYELVDTGGFVSWMDAKALAEAAGGFLATITSAGENGFLTTITGGVEAYIGATDEGVEGTFVWITGEPFGFTNWAVGEPNDQIAPASPIGEDYAVINPPGNPAGTWNDLPNQPLRVTSYVVEFNTTPSSIPEPSTLLLLSSGVAVGAAGLLRRRRSA